MTDQIVGAFSIEQSNNFTTLSKDRFIASLYKGNEKSILVHNNCLILVASNREITSLLKENVFITYVGQITGYLVPIPSEHKKNTLHTLWYLYKQYGNSFAKHINGHFVIILWDGNSDQFLLIQDKFPGIKTLYWTREEGSLYFSNYIKPLLALRRERVQDMNKKALYQFLKNSYISAPNTIFKGVWQVCAGEIIEIRNSNFTKYIYDPWQFSCERIIDKEEAVEQYQNVLNASIQTFRNSDLSCGFLLSGGFDTSVNVALAAQQISEPLTTIGVGALNHNTDAPYARKVSKLFKTEHYEYLVRGSEINELPKIISQMENPYYEPGIILAYCALKHASKYVKNVLGGDAADQVFGACTPKDYNRFKMNKNSFGIFNFSQHIIRMFCRNSLTERNSFFRKVENKLIGKYDINNWCGVYGFSDCELKRIIRQDFYFEEKFSNFEVPQNDLYRLFEFSCTVLNKDYGLYGILIKSGRMADLVGIKTFSPYLDKNVFNFILTLDHSLRTPPVVGKSGQFFSKYLHKELAKRVLPSHITNRPKQGGAIDPYVHLENRDRLEAIKRGILKSDFINDFFNAQYVERLFNNVQFNAVRIMLLLTLELWHYIFVQNSLISIPTFTLDEYLENRI